ncbi:MAG: ferrochelatase [Nitrospirae bacterium]|nr:ferrochelatase [Nitrospirota bacterium]
MNMTGVLLLNLGGPDSLGAVRPFLYNLFSDREIIRLGPSFMQKPLAYLISSLRHKKTESYYRQIGGKSPILEITTAQAQALEDKLNGRSSLTGRPVEAVQPSALSLPPSTFKVFPCMRYWRPFTEEVLPSVKAQGIKRVLALTLYPHYSVATTGSSVSKLKEVANGLPIELYTITSWYDHPLYIEALVEKIHKGLGSFAGGGPVHVLFSAHSLPSKFIEDGDPYADHIKATIDAVTERIRIEYDLSYQSKSGPVKWLEPSTEDMLRSLAGRGIKNLLVVPISFVSDHIETLYEIDIQYKAMAAELGMDLRRTESLNTSPLFISALADIVFEGTRKAQWTE